MKIAAFDLGSNMAVAYRDWSGEIVTEFKHFKGTRVERARATLIWLQEIFEGSDFDAFVYERPFVRGQDATRSLWGIAGLIEAVSRCPALDYSPGEIKKWATGKGNAGKGGEGQPAGMIEFAREAGYVGDNEHEADAYNLLRFAEATFTITKAKK